jgi:four helix bundle protein
MPSSYRDLKVWQDAMALAVRLYEITKRFPPEERYGIVQQMRRAVVSISSNIAEGYGRRTAKQRYNFLENSLGSAFELETQIELSIRLGFVADADAEYLSKTIRDIGRGLTALMRFVKDEAKQEKNRYT